MFKTSLITIIATVATLASVSPALAGTVGDTTTFKVSTAGLDLQTVSGSQIMVARIQAAAKGVCGGAPIIADLSGSAAWNVCVTNTVHQALQQMHQRSTDLAYRQGKTQTLAANGR